MHLFLSFSPTLYPPDGVPAGANNAGITGIVMDAGTNAPIAGASVTAVFGANTYQLTADTNGYFSLSGLQDLQVDLTFSASGYETNTFGITLVPLENLDIGQVRLRKQGVEQLLPDLVVSSIDRAAAVNDPATLSLSGELNVTVHNQGTSVSPSGFNVLAFYDADGDGMYGEGVDALLGQEASANILAVASSETLAIQLQGNLPFRDAPISVWVDSTQTIVESDETNNHLTTSSACSYQPDIGTFAPVEKWRWSGGSVTMTPMVGPLIDTNSDGKINRYDDPIIVFISDGFPDNHPGVLKAVNGKTGQQVWSLASPTLHAPSQLAIADVDGDGKPEIIGHRYTGGGTVAINGGGTVKWTSPYPNYTITLNYGGYSVADLDGDGHAEILIDKTVLNYDGSLRWVGQGTKFGGQINAVADINLDGRPELVVGPSAYDADGNLLWVNDSLPDGKVGIANFNDDPYPEIVISGGRSVSLLDHLGNRIWGPVNVAPRNGGAPTIGDADGDGHPDIGVAGASRYYLIGPDGVIKWSYPIYDGSEATGSTFFDFDGDGSMEVVYFDEQKLRVFDGKTGAVVFSIPNTSVTAYEYPVIADVDGDNHAELIVPSYDTSKGVRVFDDLNNSWVNTRRIWNQYAYHVNNIDDNGAVPKIESNSWDSHNSYRMNALLSGSATGIPDITAGLATLVDNGVGILPSLTVRIGNAGAGATPDQFQVALYQGDPDVGGVLLGTAALAVLAPGEYRDVRIDNVAAVMGGVDLFVVADSNQAVSECDENNNVARVAAITAPLGQITAATDKQDYGAGEGVAIQATVNNTGALPGDYSVAFSIEDSAGVLVASLPAHAVSNLQSGTAADVFETWNTGPILAGAYQVRAQLLDGTGRFLNEATTPFNIVAPAASVGVSVSTDRPSYAAWDAVAIIGRASNTATNAIQPATSMDLTVTDPTGAVLYSATRSVGELQPGALRDFAFSLVLADAAGGTYTVMIALMDETTDGIVASNAVTFQVARSAVQGLTGTVAVAAATVDRGTPNACDDAVTNQSTLSASLVEVHHQLVAMDTEALLDEAVESIDLPAGSERSYHRDIDTQTLAPGGYACIVKAVTNGEERVLDFASFQVNEPPIHIDATLTTAEHGRLLVLVDSDTGNAITGGNATICSGMITVDLGLVFNPELNATATAVIELKDGQGAVIDTESVDLTTINGPVNAHPGSGGIDLQISEFSPQSARLRLDGTASSAGVLDDSYTVVTTFTDGANVLVQESTPLATGCAEPVFVGDIFGGYQVLALQLADAANDPLASNAAPALWYQRAFVENLLDDAGWSYTLVTNADDFTRELRTGGYQVYALFSEEEHLSEQVQKELREAVYRGEGLLVAGGHDERNGRVEAALGVKITGKHSDATGVTLDASALHAAAETGLVLDEHVLKVELAGASAIGHFQFTGSSSSTTVDSALTTYTYGAGKSVLAGLDLLAKATAAGTTSVFAELIGNALSYVHPATITTLPGAVVPVKLTLTNQGVATLGVVTLTLPSGMSVVDANDVAVLTTSTLQWSFTLAEQETLTRTLWLRLHDVPGALTLTAHIDTGTAPGLTPYVDMALNLNVQAEALLGDVISQIATLAADKSQPNAYGTAQSSLERAQSNLNGGDDANALKELLKADDDLMTISGATAGTLRTQLSQIIRATERRL